MKTFSATPGDTSEWPRPVLADDVTRDLYDRIKEIAATDANVRICGGPGVGKRTWAHEIHRLSERKNGPFAELNFDGIPDALIATALFGSVGKASKENPYVGPGVLEFANGGTVMLIGFEELPMPVQDLLSRALDERSVRRVGETVPRAIDVRVIAISHGDLQSDRIRGHLRADLPAQLGEISLGVPSLRERPKEVPILAQQFLHEACPKYGRSERLAFPADTIDRMAREGFPGGVRELRYTVEVALARGPGFPLFDELVES